MSYTRRANPKWSDRHGMTMNHAKEADYSINYDRQGNTRRNHWATTWTNGSTKWAKQHTNSQHRIAAKRQIQYELEMMYEGIELDRSEDLDWYDDEEMELPDWWYSPFDDYEYAAEPDPEPSSYEDEHDYAYDYDYDYDF